MRKYRSSITTPHKLPYLNPIKSLRILLTATERRRPYILYLTPGLMLAESLHVVYVTLILGPLHRLLVPMIAGPGGFAYPDISPIKLAVYFAVVVLSTGVLTPLEVIATRLAIQRNHASSEYNSVSQEVDGDAEEIPEFAGAEEDVIGCVRVSLFLPLRLLRSAFILIFPSCLLTRVLGCVTRRSPTLGLCTAPRRL